MPRLSPRAVAACTVLGAVAVALVVALGVRVAHRDEALPGVRVAGVGVSGLTAAEVARRLRPVLSADRALLLRADGRLLRVRPRDAGYAVDLAGTGRAAVRAGRSGLIGGTFGPLWGLAFAREVAPRVRVSADGLRRAVARIAGRVGRDAYAGGLKIDPATRAVSVVPSRPGRTVERDELADRIRRALDDGERGPIDVPLRPVDAVPRKRLDALAAAARRFLRAPLRLTGAGSPLTVSTAELASLVTVQAQDRGRRARLGVEAKALDGLLDRVARHGDRRARSATIDAPATTTRLTDKGDVSWRPRRAEVTVRDTARPGRKVDRKALSGRIARALRAGEHHVTVPTRAVPPPVSAADARRVTDLIGTFTTPYVAGQPRVTNIRRMARTVDGTVVPAGRRFSLNGITGERTKAKGYVPAPYIAGNRIEPSVGGGVSQFSTTTYNAAFFAGLPLDVHQAHSLYIARYPPGRESTLNYPDIDLVWTNDTDAPILVRAAYDDAGVTVSLYGDNGGRRVTAKAGDREPVDGGDFQITVTRTIRYPDGRVERQPQTTRYANEEPPAEEAPPADQEPPAEESSPADGASTTG